MNEKHDLSLLTSVYHAADSLGLYRAELARLLGLMCGQVSDARQLESMLAADVDCQQRAERFTLFYETLEMKFSGDAVAMQNWFRRNNAILGNTPVLAMIDEGRLEDVMGLPGS